MTYSERVLRHRIVGFSGSLIGCACTAFAPDAMPLRIAGFRGILISLAFINWFVIRPADDVQHSGSGTQNTSSHRMTLLRLACLEFLGCVAICLAVVGLSHGVAATDPMRLGIMLFVIVTVPAGNFLIRSRRLRNDR